MSPLQFKLLVMPVYIRGNHPTATVTATPTVAATETIQIIASAAATTLVSYCTRSRISEEKRLFFGQLDKTCESKPNKPKPTALE